MSRSPKGSFPCPVCGEEVPEGALSCRACGADDETGWKEDAETERQELDLPETSLDDEDYDDFVRTEVEGRAPEPAASSGPGCLAIVLIALVVGTLLALVMSKGESRRDRLPPVPTFPG